MILPLDMSNLCRAGFFGFTSRTANMCYTSKVLLPDPLHPCSQQREPQHLHLFEI